MREFDILIENGIILTLGKKGIIKKGIIGIKGKKIEYVGERINCKAKKIINAEGCIVMPGFINSHTHAAMVFLRGVADDIPLNEWLNKYIWPLEAQFVSREWVRDASYLAVLEMIKGGTTTFVDMYFFEDETAKVCKEAGIKGVLGEGILKFSTPSIKNSNDIFVFLKDFIKEYQDDEYVYPAIAPHSVYATDEKQILKGYELAVEHKIPFFLHAAETEEEIKESLRIHGKPPIEYLESIDVLSEITSIVHGVWVKEKEMEILKKQKVGIIHNPQSNLKLGSGIAPVDKYIEKEIKLGIGTDGAASNNDLDMVDEIRTASLIHKGHKRRAEIVPAEDVVKMATVNGAEIWGINSGKIEEKRDADLILLEIKTPHTTPFFNLYSLLAYSAKSTDVKTVIINGKIVMENRRLLTLDEERILQKAEEWKEKIKK